MEELNKLQDVNENIESMISFLKENISIVEDINSQIEGKINVILCNTVYKKTLARKSDLVCTIIDELKDAKASLERAESFINTIKEEEI